MKNKLVVILMLSLLLVTACDRSEKVEDKKSNDTETVDNNAINTESTQVENDTAEEERKTKENKKDELADCARIWRDEYL